MNEQLIRAYQQKDKDYTARTEHFKPDGTPSYINRLILSDSIYLLQHAHNPVNWYSWSDEALATAKAQNKLIFLSVGYSTCHWCHVMEKESFENKKVAEVLKQNYIAIKVDREQHPQIDNYYMNALTSIQGSGGWPMSVFLLPNGKAVHAETYMPPDKFMSVLHNIQDLWQQDKEKLVSFADNLAGKLEKRQSIALAATAIDDKIVRQAVTAILANHDDLEGGFSDAPKFPHENFLLFLLDYNLRVPDKDLRDSLHTSLSAMATGGIYDQVGGGFHRYSTDTAWLVPHFEKMLYNQAMLARVYLDAFRAEDNAFYQQIAKNTLDYVLRDLTDEAGGFHAATDADSGDGEGEYFTWTKDEIKQVLSEKDAAFVTKHYNLSDNGNFEGRNILHTTDPVVLTARIESINAQLLAARNRRDLPLKDNKIITAWNGLMINALAQGAVILEQDKYLDVASKAAERIWLSYEKDKKLKRVINSNQYIPAVLDDYAFYIEALLGLYDVTFADKWRQRAEILADDMLVKFYDEKNGGFFINQSDGEFKTKVKEHFDGAIYSALATVYGVLNRLYRRSGQDRYLAQAQKLLTTTSGLIAAAPPSSAYFLMQIADEIHGETGLAQYAARGHIKIVVGRDDQGVFIKLKFDKNWHVNSNKPLSENLIATELGGDVQQIQYPPAEIKNLKFQKSKLSLFDQDSKIYFKPTNKDKRAVIRLSLQACSEVNCLPPEKLSFYLPAFYLRK